jgi:hypothetical protein
MPLFGETGTVLLVLRNSPLPPQKSAVTIIGHRSGDRLSHVAAKGVNVPIRANTRAEIDRLLDELAAIGGSPAYRALKLGAC